MRLLRSIPSSIQVGEPPSLPSAATQREQTHDRCEPTLTSAADEVRSFVKLTRPPETREQIFTALDFLVALPDPEGIPPQGRLTGPMFEAPVSYQAQDAPRLEPKYNHTSSVAMLHPKTRTSPCRSVANYLIAAFMAGASQTAAEARVLLGQA